MEFDVPPDGSPAKDLVMEKITSILTPAKLVHLRREVPVNKYPYRGRDAQFSGRSSREFKQLRCTLGPAAAGE